MLQQELGVQILYKMSMVKCGGMQFYCYVMKMDLIHHQTVGLLDTL